MELQIIQNKIFEIRGLKVILDKDLALMYEVTTGNLNKAVKRNADRFPDDFMFQLTNEEFDLIFQNGTSRLAIKRIYIPDLIIPNSVQLNEETN